MEKTKEPLRPFCEKKKDRDVLTRKPKSATGKAAAAAALAREGKEGKEGKRPALVYSAAVVEKCA